MEFYECVFCQSKFPIDLFNTFCQECREPLLYHIPHKKRNFHLENTHPLDIFKEFLPFLERNPSFRLGEVLTPLIETRHLTEKTDGPHIFVKNEIFNPTGSFKDRGSIVAVQKAISLGLNKIGTVSTGNMAASTAAYGARAGLETFILVKENIPPEKLISTSIYNPKLIRVEGNYGELFHKSFEMGRKFNISFMNSVDPLRIEGYKMIGFEIYCQLNQNPPQFIFAPVSSGGHLIGLMRAFNELKRQHMIDQCPTFVGVQSQAYSSVAQAFASGLPKVKKVKSGKTIAQAISNPNPPGGNILLKMTRENNGLIIDVSDEEILLAQKLLAEREGIFCQPASATTLAGFIKLKGKIRFNKNDHVVLVITGSGLKAIKALESRKINISETTLDKLEDSISSLVNK